jgi:hypothetical protein
MDTQKRRKRNEEKAKVAVQKIIEIFNEYKLSPKELVETLSTVMFSLGKHYGKYSDDFVGSSEKIMLDYSSKPNLWNTLLAQAIWMKELWVEPDTEKENE